MAKSRLWYYRSMQSLELQEEYASALFARIDELAEARRTECLWFLWRDYLPSTIEERLRVLEYLEQRGDRATFIAARNLRDCLSRLSKEKSAA